MRVSPFDGVRIDAERQRRLEEQRAFERRADDYIESGEYARDLWREERRRSGAEQGTSDARNSYAPQCPENLAYMRSYHEQKNRMIRGGWWQGR